MEGGRNDDRYFTRSGEPRGYVETRHLRELWFHTGTACNLACPFCLEGSKPGDRRLEPVKLADAGPFIDEAIGLGVEQFSFTGGEPLLAKDLPAILGRAAQHRPCLVLSNGTLPLQRRLGELRPLLERPHPVSFRISLDDPEPDRHDAGRGAGAFEQALDGLRALRALGFGVSVARRRTSGEDAASIERRFRNLFREQGLPGDLRLVSFPDFHLPGSRVTTPEITEHCMTAFHTAESRAAFMCASSRMVVKTGGRMRVYACTLVDDDPEYDLGATLAASLAPRVMLRHHRCFSCFRYGASCSELPRETGRRTGADACVNPAS